MANSAADTRSSRTRAARRRPPSLVMRDLLGQRLAVQLWAEAVTPLGAWHEGMHSPEDGKTHHLAVTGFTRGTQRPLGASGLGRIRRSGRERAVRAPNGRAQGPERAAGWRRRSGAARPAEPTTTADFPRTGPVRVCDPDPAVPDRGRTR